MKISTEDQSLHKRAIELARTHRNIEAELIAIIQCIDEKKIFKKLGYSSLFMYALRELDLTESLAYSFSSVARKAKSAPALQEAIATKTLSVAKASRIVSVLDAENAETLVKFAKTHTTRETEREVARRNPQKAHSDRVKALSENLVQLQISISNKVYEKLKRAQSVAAQKGLIDDLNTILDVVLTEYLNRHDPVEKANRNRGQNAKNAKNFCARRNSPRPSASASANYRSGSTRRLSAGEKHPVHRRDRGQCTFIDPQGRRCDNDRWIHLHHITPKSLGGKNHPANLQTLCSFHHAFIHYEANHEANRDAHRETAQAAAK
jgi:hypothetical protein